MRGSAVSAALLVGLAQAHPTKTTEGEKRSPQFEWVGRPSTGLVIPGQPIQPPRCDPRIHGICVVRPPKRDVDEPLSAQCDPRIIGLCVVRPIKRDISDLPDNQFNLPSTDSKRKDLIKLLEGELIRLQNKPGKDKADLAAIDFIKQYLKKLAGIIYHTAPDGTVSIFVPGKRDVEERQTLGKPEGPNAPKEVIKRLQKELQKLQQKKKKTPEDLEQIDAIKAALRYLAGIVEFKGPAGGTSTFVPGKRQSDTEKAIKELQRQLLALQNKSFKDEGDDAMIAALQAMIKYTQGITSINAPPGVNTTLTIPGNP